MQLLWLIVGLVVGSALTFLYNWMRGKDISIRWYEWLIGVIGVLLALFAVINYGVAIYEPEPGVAVNYLIWVGIPAVILMAVAWQLVYRHNRST